MPMDDLEKSLLKNLKDDEFAEEYRRLEPEYEMIKALIDLRAESGLTQKEFAERCGMKQSAISRLEAGRSNPTLKTLSQIARHMGKTLRISFE